MSDQDRRTFLKRAAGAVPGAAVAGSLGLTACGPEERAGGTEDAGRPVTALPTGPLRAVAAVVLPVGALGEEGAADAVRGFLAWVDGFEPAAELDHAYLTGALRYGLAHPGPRWSAQLEAMDLEASRRSGVAFAALPEEERRDTIARALGRAGSEALPGDAAQADHVALGLLAWFYGTSRATDLCYEARVGRHACRGIESLPDEPAPLQEEG